MGLGHRRSRLRVSVPDGGGTEGLVCIPTFHRCHVSTFQYFLCWVTGVEGISVRTIL